MYAAITFLIIFSTEVSSHRTRDQPPKRSGFIGLSVDETLYPVGLPSRYCSILSSSLKVLDTNNISFSQREPHEVSLLLPRRPTISRQVSLRFRRPRGEVV